MSINYLQLKKIEEELKKYPNKELLIVTKNQPQEIILELINLGYKKFGENRVQEALSKFKILEKDIEVHLIGSLQTNKVNDALKFFYSIQTLDRPKLIHEIVKIKKENKIKSKSFFLQVNIGKESQKSGVSPEELSDLYFLCIEQNLKIDGLMCIPPFEKDPRYFFDKMVELRNNCNPNLKLSMGMSSDYQIALKHSSNIVRIGSLIFN